MTRLISHQSVAVADRPGIADQPEEFWQIGTHMAIYLLACPNVTPKKAPMSIGPQSTSDVLFGLAKSWIDHYVA